MKVCYRVSKCIHQVMLWRKESLFMVEYWEIFWFINGWLLNMRENNVLFYFFILVFKFSEACYSERSIVFAWNC